jgi:hypothetical protein
VTAIASGPARYNGVQSLYKFYGAGDISLDVADIDRFFRPFCYIANHGYSYCCGIFLSNMGWSHRQFHSLLLEGHTWHSLLADYFHYSDFTNMALCHLLNKSDVHPQRYYAVSACLLLKIKMEF